MKLTQEQDHLLRVRGTKYLQSIDRMNTPYVDIFMAGVKAACEMKENFDFLTDILVPYLAGNISSISDEHLQIGYESIHDIRKQIISFSEKKGNQSAYNFLMNLLVEIKNEIRRRHEELEDNLDFKPV